MRRLLNSAIIVLIDFQKSEIVQVRVMGWSVWGSKEIIVLTKADRPLRISLA